MLATLIFKDENITAFDLQGGNVNINVVGNVLGSL